MELIRRLRCCKPVDNLLNPLHFQIFPFRIFREICVIYGLSISGWQTSLDFFHVGLTSPLYLHSREGWRGEGGRNASSTYGCPGLRCTFSAIFVIWGFGVPTLVCKLPTIFVIEVSQFEIRDESLIGLFGSERREGQRVELRKLSFKRHR